MALRNTDSSLGGFRSVDWVTVVIYLVLVLAGAVSIYAASYDFDNASLFDLGEFSGKQLLWIGLSVILGSVILIMDYRIFKTYAYPIYIGILFLLLITIFIAPDVKGSHSWIVMGPVSLQPAEFGKFATALALAKLFDSYNFSLNANPNNYFRALIIIFLPVILILLQNETGSSLVYFSLIFVLYREGMSGLVLFSIFCAILYFVLAIKFADPLILGIPCGEFSVFVIIMLILVLMLIFYCKDVITGRNVLLWFVGSGALVTVLALCGVVINGLIYFITAMVVALIYTAIMMFHHRITRYMVSICFSVVSVMFLFSVNYAYNNILQPHQQQRIKVTLGIEENLQGAGYNVNQSKIAIGSGGVTGKGFLNGTQTKLKYVPEQHTDFIFCTIGEEQGFIGASAVLLLFLVLILRLIHIAERQRSPFERVYAYCVVSILIFHLCINIGMVIGLCPVIGIPLPFFSYGGSSLWGFTILLFILLRLDASRKERLD